MNARGYAVGLGIARVLVVLAAIPAACFQRLVFHDPSSSVSYVCHDDWGMFWYWATSTIPFCIVFGGLVAALSVVPLVVPLRAPQWSSPAKRKACVWGHIVMAVLGVVHCAACVALWALVSGKGSPGKYCGSEDMPSWADAAVDSTLALLCANTAFMLVAAAVSFFVLPSSRESYTALESCSAIHTN
eukprot:m51a1_g12677 hypothetical protein (187) ;mRNA; f:2194-2808